MTLFHRLLHRLQLRIAVMTVLPGDVVIVTSREPLSDHDRENAMHSLQFNFPQNRVLVVDDGMEIAIARPSA